MHTMHTFIFIFYNPLYSKGSRGVEGMRCLMHTARIPMHTTGFFSNTGKKKRAVPSPESGSSAFPSGRADAYVCA